VLQLDASRLGGFGYHVVMSADGSSILYRGGRPGCEQYIAYLKKRA
jgi:hypothetical protein